MKKVQVVRLENTASAVRGVLKVDGRIAGCTLERPSGGNQQNVSCIPPGCYQIRVVDSPKFGRVYEVQEVPDRSHILMHSGNTAADTEGCILVGGYFGVLSGGPAILQSRVALTSFMEAMNDEDAELQIVEVGDA